MVKYAEAKWGFLVCNLPGQDSNPRQSTTIPWIRRKIQANRPILHFCTWPVAPCLWWTGVLYHSTVSSVVRYTLKCSRSESSPNRAECVSSAAYRLCWAPKYSATSRTRAVFPAQSHSIRFVCANWIHRERRRWDLRAGSNDDRS